MIRKAAVFAANAHKGAVRKGGNIPYITHPLDTALIVSSLTEDEELIPSRDSSRYHRRRGGYVQGN